MNKIDLAYLAGVFDGEGCIQIAHDKPYKRRRCEQHSLVCSVTSTTKILAEPFLPFGGTINIKKLNHLNPQWKDQYCWRISSNQATGFLELIKPYLRLRVKEAECAIEFQKFRTGAPYNYGRFGKGRKPISEKELNRREWYRQELRRLKDSRFPERSWHNDERKPVLA